MKAADEKAVAANIAATKKAVAGRGDLMSTPAIANFNAIDRELTEIEGEAGTGRIEPQAERRGRRTAKKSLPVAWQQPVESAGLAERGRWQDEFDDLTNRGVEKKFTDLQAARGGLDSLCAKSPSFSRKPRAFRVKPARGGRSTGRDRDEPPGTRCAEHGATRRPARRGCSTITAGSAAS